MPKTDISLYGIIGESHFEGDMMAAARQAALHGATIMQYREKNIPVGTMITRAKALYTALEGTGVPLLVNDRVDIALAAGCDGVHLGQEDMGAEDARKLLGPQAIIGLTIKTQEHMRNAPLEVLDYVCIGGIFSTNSKINPDPPVGLSGLAKLVRILRDERASNLPAGAIAGITRQNASDVINAGADGIAVIGDLFHIGDIATAAQGLRETVAQALANRHL